MGVWETIIGVVERTWHDKPRKDVVNALVELRAAMVDCQRSYDEYQAICKLGPYQKWLRRSRRLLQAVGTDPTDPKQKWVESVFTLGELTVQINEVLQIFSPEVQREMSSAAESEWRLAKTEYPNHSGVNVSHLSAMLQADLRNSSLDANFAAALQHLDAFIKENFKIEEIYAASKRLPSR
jgi:hypothetical protein